MHDAVFRPCIFVTALRPGSWHAISVYGEHPAGSQNPMSFRIELIEVKPMNALTSRDGVERLGLER